MTADEPSKGKDKTVRIGKYRVIAHLASGGMGVVYKAHDEELGRVVALKILARDLSNQPIRVERFRREARHAARLHHENIVTIYEFGEFEDLQYLALEFVDGVDLLQYICQKGRLDVTEACCIVTQAASALEHSFEQGIIHRDVKPSNLLIARRRDQLLVKLTDLGIAREVADDASRMTGAGLIVGTIDYLAPEQARDSGVADIRSDLYSLGCTFYEMLSGQPPFRGSLTELVYKHSEEPPPDICASRPEVSPRVAQIIRKMMAKKPSDRYQTPTELLVDLRRIDGPEPAPVRKVGEAVPTPPTPASAASGLQEMIRRRSQTELTRRKGTDDLTSTDRDTALIANPTPHQYRIAVGQFEKASEAIASGNYDYGVPLLLSCCALDPANLRYRQKLRQAGESAHACHVRLNVGATVVDWILKARIKAAMHTRAFGKALEMCEQILVHEPQDFSAQFEGAAAARELGLLNSAAWMLERLKKQNPKSAQVWRELARVYEQGQELAKAIALWELIAKADPINGEARQKLQELAASQAICRGGYEEILSQSEV
jgi:serine/threonine protein kinase